MNTDPPREQPRMIEPNHQHQFNIRISDTMVIRWCISCGKSWRIDYTGSGWNQWTPVREPHKWADE